MTVPASGACIGFDLDFTPLSGENHDISSLEVHETLINVVFGENEAILTLPTHVAGVDVGYMSERSPNVHDSLGQVKLSPFTEDFGHYKTLSWKVARSTVGNIGVRYVALPRPVSSTTRNGPALDLRTDQGGLMGSGVGFLAIPPDRPGSRVCATVKWDLSKAPPGTAAAWTFGEGEETTSLPGLTGFSNVQNTFFAVSNGLNRLVTPSESPTTKAFNTYWFGTPPFDPAPLGSRLRDLFERMRVFFNDTGESYRIFMRHNPFAGSLTGTALDRSFLYGYDDSEFQFPPTLEERESVLAHEMVHNWVMLDKDQERDNWYPEGLAEYYQVLLRYRLGLLSAEQYLRSVNDRLTAYYTNPLLEWSLDEVHKITWNVSHAQRVPYHRGFVLGLLVNGMIRDVTQGSSSLDDVVVALVDMRQTGGQPGVQDFLALVSGYLGDAKVAATLVEQMRDGKVMAPLPNSMDPVEFRTGLVPKKLAKFELGFDEKSLQEGDHIVRGLVRGSRAEKAGLCEGDRVTMLFGSAYNVAKDVYEARLKLNVDRGGDAAFVIEYWPRAWETGDGFVFEEIRGDELKM